MTVYKCDKCGKILDRGQDLKVVPVDHMTKIKELHPLIKYPIYFIVGLILIPIAPIFIIGYCIVGAGSVFFEN